jgi:serine/threonine-protein kinase
VFAFAGMGAATPHTVPLVIGGTETAARAALQHAGLGVARKQQKADDAVGTVIAQSPAPGTTFDGHGTVTITVSEGPGTITVPGVIGKTPQAATAALQAAGLLVAQGPQQYSPTVAGGQVMSQSPPAGKAVPQDSRVTIVVSKGHSPVAIPTDLLGQPFAQAVTELGKLGFKVTRGSDVFSDTVPSGRIVSIKPPSGLQPYGSTVMVTLSKGQDLVKVPDVRGQTFQAACGQIRAAGFQCAVKGLVIIDTVISESPPQNSKAKRGATITLTVI